MANAIIGYANCVDAATIDGGSWETSLPIRNLQTRKLGQVARSTSLSLSSTQFRVDAGQDALIRVIGLVGHSLSVDAQFRVYSSDITDFSNILSDSGWTDVFPAVYSSDDLEWEAPNWFTGRYTPAELEGFTKNLIYALPAPTQVRYWKFEFDDRSNAAQFIDIGRLFMGPGWQPKTNIAYGASIAWETSTDTQKALSGARYFDRRNPYRVAKFTTDWMTESEGNANAFEIQRRSGLDGEVLFVFDPDDTVHRIRRQFLGHLRQLSPVEYPTVNSTKTGWEIEELI